MVAKFADIFILCYLCSFFGTKVEAKDCGEVVKNVVSKLESLLIKLANFVNKLKTNLPQCSTQQSGLVLQAPALKPYWSSLKMMTLLGKQYHYNEDLRLDYFGAFEYCKKFGLQSVSIESEEENNALNGVLKNSFIWTSGNDLDRAFAFVWKSTGQPFTFTGWFGGDPNNFQNNERCVAVGRWPYGGTYGWMDAPCVSGDWMLKPMCEEP